MAINTTLAGLSTNPASNGPDGATDAPSTLDDAIRHALSFIATLRDRTQGPAFSAHQTSAQTIQTATFTKLTLDSEEYDTANAYTGSRFTPLVAGFYSIKGAVSFAPGAGAGVSVFKNGTEAKRGSLMYPAVDVGTAHVAADVYLNGTTDYVELYGYQASGGPVATQAGVATVYFQGSLARAV